MKKQLLILCAVSCMAANQLSAQCIPDLSIVTPGVYPDSLTNLAPGMATVAYSDTIQFKVYSTVSVLSVDSIRILSTTGLPPGGFTTTSNPPGMVFPGGSNGCVLIQGTPTTAGTYPLLITLRVYGKVLGNPVAPIDTVDDDYRIVVLPWNGIPDINNVAFDVFQNKPNPFDVNTNTEIDFTTPVAGKVQFKVFDMLGKELINKTIDAVPGLNKNILSPKYLKPGIYFYSLTNRSKTITRKMVVTAKP